MNAVDQPLVLVVCNDAQRLTRLRVTLRDAGYLAALSRSLDAAHSLLTQVRVDGCVLGLAGTTEEGAEHLRRHLEGITPGCPKLKLAEIGGRFPAWVECPEAMLKECLAQQFALVG